MTTYPDHDSPAVRDRRRRWSYASPAMLRFLAGASLLAGLAAAFFGVAYAVNGVTQAKAPISVSVRIRDLDRLQIQQATRTGSETDLPLRLQQGRGAFQPGAGAPGLHLYVDGLIAAAQASAVDRSRAAIPAR